MQSDSSSLLSCEEATNVKKSVTAVGAERVNKLTTSVGSQQDNASLFESKRVSYGHNKATTSIMTKKDYDLYAAGETQAIRNQFPFDYTTEDSNPI